MLSWDTAALSYNWLHATEADPRTVATCAAYNKPVAIHKDRYLRKISQLFKNRTFICQFPEDPLKHSLALHPFFPHRSSLLDIASISRALLVLNFQDSNAITVAIPCAPPPLPRGSNTKAHRRYRPN